MFYVTTLTTRWTGSNHMAPSVYIAERDSPEGDQANFILGKFSRFMFRKMLATAASYYLFCSIDVFVKIRKVYFGCTVSVLFVSYVSIE